MTEEIRGISLTELLSFWMIEAIVSKTFNVKVSGF